VVQELVVDGERARGVARLEQVERVVPGVVHGEEVALGPGRAALAQEADAVRDLPSHLVGVDDRVDAPHVVGVPLHGPLTSVGGLAVLVALLETEGVHAVQEPRLGVGVVPGGQRPADPVPEADRVPGEEVDLVADGQGQQVARVPHGDARQERARPGHVAGDPAATPGSRQLADTAESCAGFQPSAGATSVAMSSRARMAASWSGTAGLNWVIRSVATGRTFSSRRAAMISSGCP